MDVEGVCRRLFVGPRRRASFDIRNYMAERIVFDRIGQDCNRICDRDRERLHVRGEAHPLLHLTPPPNTDDDDTSCIMDQIVLQQSCSIVSETQKKIYVV